MTPGWRRWAAILTTYLCLVAGAIPYRIRVPPPGQLVALSGDDLRVELDLPPPGGGQPIEAPGSPPRRQGESGEEEGATASGGRVRRDGELWIELVDMEIGMEKMRRRKEAEEEAERKMKEEEEEKKARRKGGRRWRREREGGSGDEGEIGRREIGGWNSVEVKGEAKKKEKKVGFKRFGWLAGGVRPKGEKENVLKVEGKEDGRKEWDNMSGKWGEEREERRGKVDGKVRWRSWNGRVGGGGPIVGREGGKEGKEEEEEKGEGGGKGGEGGEERKEEDKRGGGDKGEGGEEVRGLILESALVSREWHLPLPTSSGPTHLGPTPPHSTLALTFPASHFTHGGLYVVRLVGTGRVLNNPGTQRPQRDTTTTEGALRNGRDDWDGGESRGGVTPESREEESKRVKTSEKYTKDHPEINPGRDGSYAFKNSTTEGARELPSESDLTKAGAADAGVPEGLVHKEETDGKSTSQIFGRILETLKSRAQWEEYDRGAVADHRKSSEGQRSSEEKLAVGVGPESRGGNSGRKKRESMNGHNGKMSATGPAEGEGISRADERMNDKGSTSSGPTSERQKTKRKIGRDEAESGPRVGDGDAGLKSLESGRVSDEVGDHSGLSDYGDDESPLENRPSLQSKRDVRAVEDGGWERRWSDGDGESSRMEGLIRSGTEALEEVGRERSARYSGGKGRKDQFDGAKGKRLYDLSTPVEERETSINTRRRRGFDRRGRRNEESDSSADSFDGEGGGGVEKDEYRGAHEKFTQSERYSSTGKLRVKREENEERDAENDLIGTEEEDSGENVTTSSVTGAPGRKGFNEGRVSREAAKGCKENCETTSRLILAEENVLVSWPTARFTLNILSSSFLSASQTPSFQSKGDAHSRNLTFGTFETPVRVMVEIPCGIRAAGQRSKRSVEGLRVEGIGRGVSGRPEEIVKEDENNNWLKVVEEKMSISQENTKERPPRKNENGGEINGGVEKVQDTGTNVESNEGTKGKIPKRKKGDRGEVERLWNYSKGKDERRMKKDLKGEMNYVDYPEWRSTEDSEGGSSFVSETIERPEIERGGTSPATVNGLNEIRLRIRKERVTKYDINDDVLESMQDSSGEVKSYGYAMKRETSSMWGRRNGVVMESVVEREGLIKGAENVAERTIGEWKEGIREKRESGDGVSRDPKTGLVQMPSSLPFRLFLVLRYCGVDSTECDEEDSARDDVEIWRRPQTVFTKELVDFPSCPKYQHQVILPCEVFGQAGVYVVQVRSNYTLEEDEVEEDKGLEGRVGRKKREGDEFGEESKETSAHQEESRSGTDERIQGEDTESETRKSEDLEETMEVKAKHEGEIYRRKLYKGDLPSSTPSHGDNSNVGSGDRSERKLRGTEGWEGGDGWWEGSGDGEGDDGSGEWGEGWPEVGRGRREGSGDVEYSDDPDGFRDSGSTARRKLPDPPPLSLWSSSNSMTVHLSLGYVFTVHAKSVFPCSDAHVRPETLEPAPSGVPVLFEYPECILEGSDRVRVFGRARPDVSAILPPFWMGTDSSVDAAVTLSHPSLRYVAEKKIYKGKHNAWFDCSLFTERYSEYCFAYASEAMTGAVTHVRAQCIPTLPTSDEDRGGWGSWSSWSQCSTTCGSGSRNRYRTCDNPPPRYGAPFCEGTALETERCPPPSGVSYEELQEMCPLGLALSAGDDANRKGNEPNCRCGGCIVHLQGVAGTWGSRNAGPIKPRARLIASSSQACPGRSFWLLQAEPGHVVGLTVSSLLLPCPRRQWLKARDGDSLSARLILHLPSSSPSSSSSNSPPFNTETMCFSSGPHLLLEFYSFERLEPTCNGGFLAHAHQVLANSSASAIGRDVLLAPTTRAVPRSSLSVHAAALAFILALVALSGGLALNYVSRRRRFNEELKKREKEEEEMSDSDSDTKCFIARNKDGGSATSVTSVSDVISLRKLSIGKDGRRREVHMRLTEESDEDAEEEEDAQEGEAKERGEEGDGRNGASQSADHDEPAKASLPKVEVLQPGSEKGKKGGRRRGRESSEGGGEEGGDGGSDEEEEVEGEGEVTRRKKRKGVRREWRESACPLLEQETVAQSSVSLPSSPTDGLVDDPTAAPNAPGRPGLSASAPLLLRRSLSFFAATASASTAGAAVDSSSSEGVAQSISAAGKQWWRKKMQKFQNGSVSPVREELEETWRLAEPHSPKRKPSGKTKKQRPSSEVTPPAKECKEKQNRERLLRAGVAGGGGGYYPNPVSSAASDSPSATTSPEMGAGGRLRGRLRARVDDRGKCTSEASLAGGVSELDLEFDYYDYNVQNAGAAPGSYLGMDPAFLVYIPPFEGSTSPSSDVSSASTLQAPPSEAGTDTASPQPTTDGGANRGDYYCINASYARANFSNGLAGSNGVGSLGSDGGGGEMLSMAEFRRESLEDDEEEGRGSEKETRVEKSPVEESREEEEDEIKFADDDESEEGGEEVERAKREEEGYGVITTEGVGLRKPV